MKGRVALVTGGSRGIGRAIALKLASGGADVAILYAGNAAAAEEAVQAIEAQGTRALALRCDVADYAQVEAAVKRVKDELGLPEILVNNAGVTLDKLAMRMSADEFRRVVDVNLNGAFHLIRALLPDFVRRRSGRIVNITSVSGLIGNAGQANYAAAKAGMIGLTKSVAREVASRGITVNAVAPGFVETDMTGAMDGEVLSQALANVPARRMADPAEIAAAVAFLAGSDAAYITGVVLPVDGGLSM
ncbi:MAG: 3-oxoacyl-[acyl-carrier-protein] reductase [Christensenellaceae bacterium]|nr:3-oxoacyl-[acyl-carrier-protein] reductase [Christensenellaceae bacterium]MEA5065296.1 3-oxoacyl-[acyl-carrier-protein] reductase [Eubacteriales bacterium]MEA5068996.1 3-oxoacyl-[acyl-carrier-protein] reductase [Christensenellaceae bacterium]